MHLGVLQRTQTRYARDQRNQVAINAGIKTIDVFTPNEAMDRGPP